MAQAPCESSLRPDWLATTFKSGTNAHLNQVWDLAQLSAERVAPNEQWKESGGSKHFESCLVHPIGMRFEYSPLNSPRMPGMSLISVSGMYFALSSVYEQMRLFEALHSFKGRYHYTRVDCQVTTLNPSQSAEQIVSDVNEGLLWIKGFKGFEAKGLKDINGDPTGGLSACFGAPTSDRRATSYNKGAEQEWETPARRDEIRLRGDWAEEHTKLIATSVSGASSENAAIDAYQEATATAIAQHMQYLDLKGQPKPRPKNWARNAQAPKWWSETLEQEITPVKLNRKPESDIEVRFGHMKAQWARTYAEYITHRVATGMSNSFYQATIDAGLQLFQYAKEEDIHRMVQELPEDLREGFVKAWNGSVAVAASHSEMVL